MRNKSLLLVLAVCGCATRRPAPPNLTPSDPRPLHSVSVEDGAEADILVQTLKLEPLQLLEETLYFAAPPDALARLAEAGYDTRPASRMQVEQRVVRAYGGREEEILAAGAQLINRERGYRVVRGTLAQLRTLERLGTRLTTIGWNEPRPRLVRVFVSRAEDVGRVAALELDVHGVHQAGTRWVVEAAAFDVQVDALRSAGFTVEPVHVPRRSP